MPPASERGCIDELEFADLAQRALLLSAATGSAACDARYDRTRNGSQPNHPMHPMHPLYAAKNEAADAWNAEAQKA